jgi:hypothetical protein
MIYMKNPHRGKIIPNNPISTQYNTLVTFSLEPIGLGSKVGGTRQEHKVSMTPNRSKIHQN